jgi:hypothetical protein
MTFAFTCNEWLVDIESETPCCSVRGKGPIVGASTQNLSYAETGNFVFFDGGEKSALASTLEVLS